jgi:DNA ligase-associated metallophosphoesterase
MNIIMKVEVQGEILELLPERAFFWAERSLLGLSDVHLGKAESLQRMGLPIPSGSHHLDLRRMTALIEKYNPRQILILGDWIHRSDSWTPEIIYDLQDFFDRHRNRLWTLLLGNHERGSHPYLEQLPIELIDGHLDMGPFTFTHGHLPKQSARYRIEGHVHPVITLCDGPLKMRFPCFVLKPKVMLIPSFGTLTGGFETKLQPEARIFAAGPKDVFEIRPRSRSNSHHLP